MRLNIRNKILFTYLVIILLILFSTGQIFNFTIKLYINKITRTELLNSTQLIHNVISSDIELVQKAKNDSESFFTLMQKMNRIINKNVLIHPQYAIIDNQGHIFHPQNENKISTLSEDFESIIKNNPSEADVYKIYEFNHHRQFYIATLIPLGKPIGNLDGWLIIYSDLANAYNFQDTLNQILYVILLMALIIGIIASILISKKITKPIVELAHYAHTIGDRHFEEYPLQSTGDEIEELAQSMNQMAKKLKNYDTAQKTFLQNASHELRTPLMSIQGYAEGMKHGVLRNTSEALDTIIESTHKLKTLVENLLYLSRLDTLEDSYQFNQHNLNDIIKNSIEQVAGIALKDGKEIHYEAPDKPIYLDADFDTLSRAIINLLGNSLRYCKRTIHINVTSTTDLCEILIKDDGPGFSEKDLENLFVRFYKGNKGNYGLGLVITKTIIEKHGGTLHVTNQPQSTGAQFTISLPLSNHYRNSQP